MDEAGNNKFVRPDYQLAILMGMNRGGKEIYPGTADSVVVAKRRAKNKVARKQRKYNLHHD